MLEAKPTATEVISVHLEMGSKGFKTNPKLETPAHIWEYDNAEVVLLADGKESSAVVKKVARCIVGEQGKFPGKSWVGFDEY